MCRVLPPSSVSSGSYNEGQSNAYQRLAVAGEMTGQRGGIRVLSH
jgi:hypothetical protein